MAKYNVGDKLILIRTYMNGRFQYRAKPKVVLAFDDVKGLYLLVGPSGQATEESVLDGTKRVSRYFYSYRYVDNNYRLAAPDEIITYFSKN